MSADFWAAKRRAAGIGDPAIEALLDDIDRETAGPPRGATNGQPPPKMESPAASDDRVAQEQGAEPWPEPQPLPIGLPPVQAFDPDLLPDSLRPWIRDIADRLQCPPDFPAVAAVVCLSTVVGRQVAIRPKRRDDWTVVPNLWGAVVGRPSLLKTPALAEPMKMLARLEDAAREEHEQAMNEHAARALVAEAGDKAARQAIAKAVKDGKLDPMEIARKAVQEAADEAPRRRRYTSNDGTVEKLGELLRDNPRGILVFRDELVGWLQSLDREGREGNRAFYLEAWNGNGRFTFDRIGRGTVEVEATCLSLLGGIQPGPLSFYMAGAMGGGAGDDGLLQRLQLLVWPDSPRDWRNVDRWPDSAARQAAWEVFQRLDHLDQGAVGARQDEGDAVPWLRFAPDAQGDFDGWREALEARLRAGDLHAALEAHLAKYRSLVPSLALLFHLADNPGGGPVALPSLLRALAWAEYLETHARRLYGQALSPDVAAALELDRRLGELPQPFTAKDIYRNHWRFLDPEGTRGALAVMEDFNRVRGVRTGGAGRPTVRYWIHPSLRGEG